MHANDHFVNREANQAGQKPKWICDPKTPSDVYTISPRILGAVLSAALVEDGHR
jgi:hypothetical protein